MCGKVAERCEPIETLESLRSTHRTNVAEALNKFIFGNVKLYANNFIEVGQCDIFQNRNDDQIEENEGVEGSGTKFGVIILIEC